MATAAHTAARAGRTETPEQRYLRHIRTAAAIVAAATVIACALVAVLLVTVRSQDSHIQDQLTHVNSNLTELQEQGG
jgi:hypothetical protein